MGGIYIFSVYFRMIIEINYFHTFRRTLCFYYSILYFESKFLCLFFVSAEKVTEYCALREYIHCNQATAVYCSPLKAILV